MCCGRGGGGAKKGGARLIRKADKLKRREKRLEMYAQIKQQRMPCADVKIKKVKKLKSQKSDSDQSKQKE